MKDHLPKLILSKDKSQINLNEPMKAFKRQGNQASGYLYLDSSSSKLSHNHSKQVNNT
jgi:hypothetical protein